MNGQILDRIRLLFGGLITFSILFSPDLKVVEALPVVKLPDLLLPFLCGLLLISWRKIKYVQYYAAIGLFGAAMLISLAVNGRLLVIQDLFEFYKLFKFTVIILFFTTLKVEDYLIPFAKWMLISLTAVNLVHFFNILDFNSLLTKYYSGGLHIEYFGLNSLKEPAVKRMVGLSGNPNINALVFVFFSIIFFPLKWEKEKRVLFLIAVLMVFLCQSKTAILSLVAIIGSVLIFKLSDLNIKKWTFLILGIMTAYIISWAMATSFFKYPLYSNLLFNGNLMETGSARGRLEAWKLISEMIIQRPIFGYGGYKEYFYENRIYSENEYLLIAWRYGTVGLLFFLYTYYRPWRDFIGKTVRKTFSVQILSIVFLVVASLTNNPLTDRTLNLLFAVILGIGYFNFLQMKSNGAIKE